MKPNSEISIINSFNNSEILEEIKRLSKEADEIYILISYITKSGLEEIFKYIKDKKVFVLTTTKDYVTDPEGLKFLLENRISTKIYNSEENKLHSKVYYFLNKKNDKKTILLGSSNLTKNSLLNKVESNIKWIVEEEIFLNFFNSIWNHKETINNSEKFINEYSLEFIEYKRIEEEVKKTFSPPKPLDFQNEILNKLLELRKNNERTALVACATGTGKTYLSAFDVRNFLDRGDSKVLFLAHSWIILRQALKTYKNVFRNKNMDFLTSFRKKRFDTFLKTNDFIFTTDKTLNNFLSNEKYISNEQKELLLKSIDYVVFDEAHKSGGPIQSKIFESFERYSKFILALTATPERSDNKFLLYKRFKNIAGKILIPEAIKKNLICKYEYYGESVNLGRYNTRSKNIKPENIFNMWNTAFEKIRSLETWDKSKVKGIVFCSSIPEAKYLNEIINKNEYLIKNRKINSETVYSGNNSSEEELEIIFSDLKDEKNDLSLLITVDKFNEGIDIPEINTIVMFRFTESSIVYTQQIGRGLRKIENKDSKKYLNIIDLVGNYKNSFDRIGGLLGEDSPDVKKSIDKILELYENGRIDKIVLDDILNNMFTNFKISNNVKKTILYQYLEDDLKKIDLQEIINKTNKKINEIVFSFKKSKTFTKNKDEPWLISLLKFKFPNFIDKDISDDEKCLIELFSWFPLTVSTAYEKNELLKLIKHEGSKLSWKWISYFKGVYYKNKALKVSQMVRWNGEYYFEEKYGEFYFKRKDFSKEFIFIKNIIIKYIEKNINFNNFLEIGEYYSNAQIVFMFNGLHNEANGFFSDFEDKNKKVLINKTSSQEDFSKRNRPYYENEILDSQKVIVSFDKTYQKDEIKKWNIYNFIGSDKFYKKGFYLYKYIGEYSALKFNFLDVKEIKINGKTKKYQRCYLDILKLSLEDLIFLQNSNSFINSLTKK